VEGQADLAQAVLALRPIGLTTDSLDRGRRQAD
jgi:hypothetical protein